MYGHYRTMGDVVQCVVYKEKSVPIVSRARRRKNAQNYNFEVPDQDFHFVSILKKYQIQIITGNSLQDMEICGKNNNRLKWQSYSVVSRYKNGNETVADLDISSRVSPLREVISGPST